MDEAIVIASRPAPSRPSGLDAGWLWARRHLFGHWTHSLATLAIAFALVTALPHFLDWAVWHAVFVPDLAACRLAHGHGACWGVVAEKIRLILFGRYPFDEQWRPMVASALLVLMIVLSCLRRFWRPATGWMWLAGLSVIFLLMRGGVAGLAPIETESWGGLPLTLLLATGSVAIAFVLAVLLALGRQSRLGAIRSLCVVFIEVTRGLPLISVLFMASFILPLFMPAGSTIDVLVRVFIGMTLFTSAYLAEVIRGGLQALPAGQVEAAQALGLSYWQTQRKIVLPQALRHVVPAIVNTFIGAFKDTSLVTIVSLYDLTGAVQLALGDPQWRRFFIEGQLFVALIYLVACLSMSHYSRWIERQLTPGGRNA